MTKKCTSCGEIKPLECFGLMKKFSGRYIYPTPSCKPCLAKREKQRRVDKRDEIRKKDKIRNDLRKESVKPARRAYYLANKEKFLESARASYLRRKELGLKRKTWVPKGDSKIRMMLSGRARPGALPKTANEHWLKYVGATVDFVKAHIEAGFTNEMSWDNYGRFGWHVDHYLPISSFDLRDEFQAQCALNWRNLRPIPAIDNLKKAASLPCDHKVFREWLEAEIIKDQACGKVHGLAPAKKIRRFPLLPKDFSGRD